MGIHITKYKTEGGKTRKAKQPAKGKDGAPGKTGADSKNQQPGSPAE